MGHRSIKDIFVRRAKRGRHSRSEEKAFEDALDGLQTHGDGEPFQVGARLALTLTAVRQKPRSFAA